MASQKISQLTAVTTVASGDYFPIVLASGTTNNRVEVGVLDARYASAASGVAAQQTANTAITTANTALASGNAALVNAGVALVSGVAAGTLASQALASGLVGIASGNAALSLTSSKYAISGGLVNGQMTTVVTALGLHGSGIPCASGNYFTATLSGNSSVYFTGVPAASYGLTYEVQYDTGTITWPAEVKWPSDTPPTLTAGKTQVFVFQTDDSGSRWRAAALVDYTT